MPVSRVSRDDLRHLLRRVGFPPRSVGRRVVVGEAAWEQVVARLLPGERVDLVRSLAPRELLTATPGARARVRGWVKSGFWLPQWGPPPDQPGCFLSAAEVLRAREERMRRAAHV